MSGARTVTAVPTAKNPMAMRAARMIGAISPVGSVYRAGLFTTYGYRFRVCGMPRAPRTGSRDVNRPVEGSYWRARRYVCPVTVSFRSPRNVYLSDEARDPDVPHGRPKGSYDVEKTVAFAASD